MESDSGGENQGACKALNLKVPTYQRLRIFVNELICLITENQY